MDREDISHLEDELERLSKLLDNLKQKYPEESPTEEMGDPWMPFFNDGSASLDSFRVIQEGKTILFEASPNLRKRIELKNSPNSEAGGVIKTALLRVPFLAGIENEWKELHGIDSKPIQPSPLPLDSLGEEDGSDSPWLICKVSIRKGSPVRFHLSKAWSKVILNTKAGRHLIGSGIKFEQRHIASQTSLWKLKKGCMSQVGIPMKIFSKWEGDTLRLNLPSWWSPWLVEGSRLKRKGRLESDVSTLSQSMAGDRIIEGTLRVKRNTNSARCHRTCALYGDMKVFSPKPEKGEQRVADGIIDLLVTRVLFKRVN